MHLFLSFLTLEILEIKFLTREIYENLFVVDHEHKMRKKKRGADIGGLRGVWKW